MEPELPRQIKAQVLNDYLHHKGQNCNHGTEKVGRKET